MGQWNHVAVLGHEVIQVTETRFKLHFHKEKNNLKGFIEKLDSQEYISMHKNILLTEV